MYMMRGKLKTFYDADKLSNDVEDLLRYWICGVGGGKKERGSCFRNIGVRVDETNVIFLINMCINPYRAWLLGATDGQLYTLPNGYRVRINIVPSLGLDEINVTVTMVEKS